MADDEFVQGFLDSEWTGIAPMLEEDVASHVIVSEVSGAALLALSLDQAAAFAEALQNADTLVDDEDGAPRDMVVYRSAFFVVRTVPQIGSFANCQP